MAMASVGLLLLACAQSGGVASAVAPPRAAAQARATAPEQASSCPAPSTDTLQDIRDTPASPYFVHHPAAGLADVPTVIFIPGGAGSRRGASRAWENYLSDGQGVESFRIIIPYAVDLDFLEEFPRTFQILDEVLACYGGQRHHGG